MRPVNDATAMRSADLQIVQGSSTVLAAGAVTAADVDSAAGDLHFVVDAVSHGHFELASAPGVAVGQFSYTQLAAGQVVFVHASIVDLPQITLHPTDGLADGAPMAASVSYSGTGVLMPPAPGGSGTGGTGPTQPVGPPVVTPPVPSIKPAATTPATPTSPATTGPPAPGGTTAGGSGAGSGGTLLADADKPIAVDTAGAEGEAHVRRFAAENNLVKLRTGPVTLTLGAALDKPLMEFMLGTADLHQSGPGSAAARQAAIEKTKVPPLGDDAYAQMLAGENTRDGIAITPQNGGIYSGAHVVNVSGFYRKDTGLAHGTWSQNNATKGNTGDGRCSPNHEALYNNGQLVTGSLGGDGSRFQPAAPNTRIIGPKIR